MKCVVSECPHEGFVSPQIVVWGDFDKSGLPVVVAVSTEVCAVHKNTLQAKDVLNLDSRRVAFKALRQDRKSVV